MKKTKKLLFAILALTLVLNLAPPMQAAAKTAESASSENIFFYVKDADGKDVLLKIMTLEELEEISHGQLSGITSGADTGKNYHISSTDNYPTTQYAEGRGITLPELVSYIKTVSTVSGAQSISYTGEDTLRFMATDSYGSYNRAWTYNELYGVKRYYFEGMFNANTGWKSSWEIAGAESSKFGITLEEYNSIYKDTDPHYADKRAVFEEGEETVAILATSSHSGRTTSDSLVASTEPGIAGLIAENGGIAAGSLSASLSAEHSLRLLIPITEADLMSAHRTAYDNFKWIYNMRLDMASAPNIKSQGTIAEPAPIVSLSGNTLTISISCETPGAQIFYSFDGAPQIPYTAPLKIDVSGRDLASNPVTFYMTAVREGFDDAGIITAKYPGLAPSFETLYSSMLGENLVFKAIGSVSESDWSAWTGALNFITMKAPSAAGYLTVDSTKYTIDNTAKTITFDKELFTETGQYSFIFHAAQYANKSTSVALKRVAPEIVSESSYPLGGDVLLRFDDAEYQNGLNVYIKLEDGGQALISTAYLNRSVAGQVTIKAEYFALDSCPVKAVGEYILILTNSRYAPDSKEARIVFSASFADVSALAWYYDAVSYVTEKGLFNGTSATSFSPNDGMTRAMFVTVLGRMAEIDESAYTHSSFSDVDIGAWYSSFVTWAAENGIVTGVGEGEFNPNGFLTREQLVTIIYRYTGAQAADQSSLAIFPDAERISDWAREAFSWAVSSGVINGSDGLLLPGGTITRAQAAQILFNYSKIN